MNPAARARNRLTSEEQTGQRLTEVTPSHRTDELLDRYRKVVESGVPIVDEEVAFEEQGGPSEPAGVYTIRATRLGDGLAVSWRDISEARRMERELKRSNRELEMFAYAASHDLQEPLRAISGFLQLLERRYADKLDEDAMHLIKRAVAASHRMRALVEGLLSLSRITTRGRDLRQVSMEEAVEAASGSLQVAITESGAVVTHDPLPVVQADPVQMEQMLRNLIGNALKFAGSEAPRIHVSASRESDAWVFSVRDNGIGIDPQFHERIFVVFQRLHTREEYPGHGLGLAICQRVVERHGGRLWVESSEGGGATFRFSIPDRGDS
ncbi:MAG: PAS domain-containing sensor histidine kinase [Anaerolineae bacterium]